MTNLIKKFLFIAIVLAFSNINQITVVQAADVKYCWNKDKSKRSIAACFDKLLGKGEVDTSTEKGKKKAEKKAAKAKKRAEKKAKKAAEREKLKKERERKLAEKKARIEENRKKREEIASTKKKLAWCQEGQTEDCREDKVKTLLKKLKDLGEKNVGSLED